jgi:DNA transformation protein
MSTRPETLAFLIDQLGDWPGLRTRRMFGEYCVYVDDKPVAFVCDDLLYVKPTAAGEALMAPPVWGRFYDKAKPHLLVTPDRWDDRDWLRALISATAHALPPPKPRKTAKPAAPAKSAQAAAQRKRATPVKP